MAVIGIGSRPETSGVTKFFVLVGVDKRLNEGSTWCIRNSYVGRGRELLECDQYGVILMSSDTQFATEKSLSFHAAGSVYTRRDYKL